MSEDTIVRMFLFGMICFIVLFSIVETLLGLTNKKLYCQLQLIENTKTVPIECVQYVGTPPQRINIKEYLNDIATPSGQTQ